MRNGVFNGCVLGVKFPREIGFRDGVIMRRKMVPLITEGTDPDLGGEVDAGERVEGGGAGFAPERSVRELGNVRMRADQGDGGGERDDALAGFNFASWPNVPCHANSVDAFGICAGNLRHPFVTV